MNNSDRYAFIAEYFDPQADMIKQYQLIYFIDEGAIEMRDMKTKKLFLKKTKYPSISPPDLCVGNHIIIFSRKLKIVKYVDEYTQNAYSKTNQRTLALIKPDAFDNCGKIIDASIQNGFKIENIRLVRLTKAQAGEFYSVHKGKPFYDKLLDFMSEDPVIAMELVAENAIQKWRDLIGPTDCEQAKIDAPNSLRARFGTNKTYNACHGSDSIENGIKEISFFFGTEGKSIDTTARFSNCTVCVIRPHAVFEGLTGKIIDDIMEEGYEISALEMFVLDETNAAEFLEVYKGVIPEYKFIVEEMSTGPCVAMEIRSESAVREFRETCGPFDPEIARALRSNSLRAKYGKTKVKNAVHCTDLPEDGILESEFFFEIMKNS
eukprot:gb/GECH01012646.1/.p1 GENE.gb/GECH01012646.1/~~gb/GECH01012646.1/.p1  ORF type:complete len:377 (+),score=93.81 gb/GECH01012646.1/:1-1131(+)